MIPRTQVPAAWLSPERVRGGRAGKECWSTSRARHLSVTEPLPDAGGPRQGTSPQNRCASFSFGGGAAAPRPATQGAPVPGPAARERPWLASGRSQAGLGAKGRRRTRRSRGSLPRYAAPLKASSSAFPTASGVCDGSTRRVRLKSPPSRSSTTTHHGSLCAGRISTCHVRAKSRRVFPLSHGPPVDAALPAMRRKPLVTRSVR
jgi:hypothetical protein